MQLTGTKNSRSSPSSSNRLSTAKTLNPNLELLGVRRIRRSIKRVMESGKRVATRKEIGERGRRYEGRETNQERRDGSTESIKEGGRLVCAQ